MKMNAAQEQVVADPISDLLVSAGAGSGKTSVMTERIVEHVLSGELDLRRILVMTFTNAAASNMRRKIEKKLTDALKEETDPGQRSLVTSQLSALSSAHISTIHSFCLDVIHNFGYDAKTPDGQLVVEPGFATADQTRAELLLLQAVDDVLSTLYEEQYEVSTRTKEERPLVRADRDIFVTAPFLLAGDTMDRACWFSDFERMLASYGNHRNDLPLREMILSMYAFLRSMPDYVEWSRQKLEEMQETGMDFVSSSTAKAILDEFRLALSLCEENLARLSDMLPAMQFVKSKKNNDAYQAFIFAQIAVVNRLLDARARGELDFETCHACAGELPEGKLPSRKKDDDSACAFWERYDSVSEVLCYLGTKTKVNTKSFKTNARPVFMMSPDQISKDILFMHPVVSRLFETIILVDDRFRKLKRDENIIDFSDYEHIALLVLRRPEASAYYSGLFDEIYIDEYQDNSRIQERIVSCFSKGNCFAVGDVKQSIYRFRHAQPAIFLERMEEYREKATGTVRELTTNYRSVPGIIDFVNDLFGQILSKESGELDYDETHRLDSGVPASVRFSRQKTVEFLLVNLAPLENDQQTIPDDDPDVAGEGDKDASATPRPEDDPVGEGEVPQDAQEETRDVSPLQDPSDDREIDRDKVQKEADVVASHLLALKNETGLAWQDFAVLCRTNQEKTVIARVLSEHGIPSVGGAGEDFLSSRELLLMENLIRLLDNFNQDIPLAAVMSSFFPLANFSDDELLHIRLRNPDKGTEKLSSALYLDVQSYREAGSDPRLRDKVIYFCDWIDTLRSAAMYLPVSELIERVYSETGFREMVSSLPNGTAHVRTLDTFRSWASAFDAGRSAGLYRFVTYVAEVRSGKKQPEELAEAEMAQEAVTCTTIHKSKGLEYRVVFLTGLARSSKRTKRVGSILLTERYGIAADYIEPDMGLMYPTTTKQVAIDIETNAALAEDMRLLYVALTRAQEKLYLVSDVQVTREKGLSGVSDLLLLAREQKQERLPAWLIKKTRSLLDLCLLGIARNPNVDLSAILPEESRDGVSGTNPPSPSRTPDLSFSMISYAEFLRENLLAEAPLPEAGGARSLPSQEITPEDEELFRLQIGDTYKYAEETRTAAKITVTELKRKILAGTVEDEESTEITIECQPRTVRPVNLTIRPLARASVESNTLSPTERGTLLHSIFQYLDFTTLSNTPTIEAVDAALERLVEKKMIKPDKLIHIGPYREAIRTFSQSDLCRRMVAAERVAGKGPYREIPFSLAVPSRSDDFCLVQGMIDCWFIEDNEAILLDYKTDRITGSREEKQAILEERYGVQLEYYARAITSASNLTVRERIIWLIPDGLSFSIATPEKMT